MAANHIAMLRDGSSHGMVRLDDHDFIVDTTGHACECNLDAARARGVRGCALHFVCADQAQGRGHDMTKAFTARQRNYTPERDAARRELARGLPPPMDWRNEARRTLASDCLVIDGHGRIIRAEGAPTGLMLDPLICGRLVYIRDECGTRYWLGSPNRLRAVLRWLLS